MREIGKVSLQSLLLDVSYEARSVQATIMDQGSQDEPSQANNGISKHDRQTDPNDPAFGASIPVADIATRPALVLGDRREYCPTEDGAEKHVDCGGWAHDDALSHVRRRWVERPKPVVCEVVSSKGNAVQLGNKIRDEGLGVVSLTMQNRQCDNSKDIHMRH